MISEKYANEIYNSILKTLDENYDMTYSDHILQLGKKLFKEKFHGVYPSDQIPELTKEKPYAILNLDKSTESGSHWVAIAKVNNETYIYDSFGRKNQQIIPSLSKSGNGTIEDTDRDAEQKINELNCGNRSVAFLLLLDRFGINYAKLI